MSIIDLQTIPSRDAITADLIAIIRRHTGSAGEGWNGDTVMQDVGIESFDFVEMIFEVEEKYGIDINLNANTSTKDIKTVDDVARLVQVAIEAQGRPA